MAQLKSFMISGITVHDGTDPETNDRHVIDLLFDNVRYEDFNIIADIVATDHYIGGAEPGSFTTTYANVNLFAQG